MGNGHSASAFYRSARRMSGALPAITAVLLGLLGGTVAASPEEIQVYMDDMTKPGRFGVDVHNNFVLSGSNTPDYAGAQPPKHVYRLTPEFYYGISETLEVGLYLLTTTAPGGSPNYDGEKLRLKYVAPHDDTQGSFWGANFELGKTSMRVAQDRWNAELKGIYGSRSGNWTYVVNPNLDWSVSGPVNIPIALEVDTKVAYKTNAGYQLGFESYNQLGPLKNLGHLDHLSQMLYGAVDADFGKFDLNAGLGRGLTTASDRWVIKFVIGVHF
jgi:hypothetical protein